MEETIGQYLRRQRERRSISLETVVSQTRIQAGFLEAIEEDQFDKIPHSVSAKGFIRSYAQFLQLDPMEALKRYPALVPPEPASEKQPDLYKEPLLDMGQIGKPASLRFSFDRFLKVFLQAIAVAGLLALFLAWLVHRNSMPVPLQTDSERGLPAVQGSVPTTLSPPSPKTEEAPIPSLPDSQQEISPEVNTPVMLPALQPIVEQAVPSTVSVAPPRLSPKVSVKVSVPETAVPPFARPVEVERPLNAPSPPSSPQNRAGDPVIQNPLIPEGRAGAQSSQGRVGDPVIQDPLILSLKATASTWVRVLIDQRTTKDVLLQPGDQVIWQASEAFLLTVGNAGGVQAFFNGQDLGVLGNSNEVVRDRLLTRLPVKQHEREEPF